MFKKRLGKISVFVLSSLIFFGGASVSVFAEKNNIVSTASTYDFLQDYEHEAISEVAKKFGLNEQDIESVFYFEISGKRCSLVPLCDCEEHLNCFLRLFSDANPDPDYMKYYLDGKLRDSSYIKIWFKRSIGRMKEDCPRSVTFLVKVEDKVVGRIGIGPLSDRKEVETEIGYAIEKEYSSQGFMGRAVDKALIFLKLLRKKGKACYDFTRVRATAKSDNIASNKLLESRGFVLSDKPINDGFGLENEYFYYFEM